MKKSNVIVFVILLAISVFLLWLWYYLALNRVDEPLDLVLSIAWWVILLIVIITIIRVEKSRRKHVRTVYISDDLVFNSEKGSFPYNDSLELVSLIEKILRELKYNFSKTDLPNRNAFPIRLVVRSFDFDANTWKGEVVDAETKLEASFDGKEELFEIINRLQLDGQIKENKAPSIG